MSSVLYYSTSTGGNSERRDDYDYYHAACIFGHVFKLAPGSEMEAKARARTKYLDALRIDESECPYCIEDSRDRQRTALEVDGLMGCITNGMDCTGKNKDGSTCACVLERRPIPDSPIDDQLIHYSQHELDEDGCS